MTEVFSAQNAQGILYMPTWRFFLIVWAATEIGSYIGGWSTDDWIQAFLLRVLIIGPVLLYLRSRRILLRGTQIIQKDLFRTRTVVLLGDIRVDRIKPFRAAWQSDRSSFILMDERGAKVEVQTYMRGYELLESLLKDLQARNQIRLIGATDAVFARK